MYYGYHRCPTQEQNLDRGIAGIEEFCKSRGYDLQKIYTDKMTGKTFDRPRYTVLKEDVLRQGDTLIVFELDRLGRNKADIISARRGTPPNSHTSKITIYGLCFWIYRRQHLITAV